MKKQEIKIKIVKLYTYSLRKIVFLVCAISSTPFVYAEYCPYSTAAFGGSKGPCIDDSKGKSTSNSQANTQVAIGAVQSAIGIWAEASQKQAAEREATEQAEKQQRRNQFSRDVDQAKDDPDTNPWANSASDKKDKKRNDIYLGTCVEQNFSMRSDGQFTLRNTCNYPINLKYIFSSSKPFSGTYTTLKPTEMTFETGKQGENVKFYMCPVPQTPQSLDGGCI